MSHFTRLETKLVDRQHLLSALADLGYAYEEGDVSIGAYGGQRTAVDIRVPTRNPAYGMGFRREREGDAFELVADWFGVREHDREQVLASVTRRYAYRAAVDSLSQQGFGLVSEEQDDEGRVHLVLRRMA